MSDDRPEFDERTKKIAALNDALRTTFNPTAGTILGTPGFANLSTEDKRAVINLVQTFNDFSEDNDPHGEHDFGAVKHNGETFYFKLDYYNPDHSAGSEDPADPTQTSRVMTILNAREY